MSINLKKFVDINIQPHEKSVADYVRDTVVIYTADGIPSTVHEFSNMDEVLAYESTFTSESYDTVKKYLQVYFDNGGVKAKVYDGIAYDTLSKDMIKALDNNFITIVYACTDSDRAACYTAMKNLANQLNADNDVYGINEKIIIASTANYNDEDKVKNFAVKYINDSTELGNEMTIAAYLSQTNILGSDTIYDYMFTEEKVTITDITDTIYQSIIDNNINVDVNLSGTIRNCGGNCKDGDDLVNNFVRIILHQTLTTQLINLLAQKIKSNTGISKIYAVIAQELEKYKTCGYLTTDKVWLDLPLKVDKNGKSYTIINTGDALLNGYLVKVLPMSALSEVDKTRHMTPPIYVVLADQYGIRKITITGDVI